MALFCKLSKRFSYLGLSVVAYFRGFALYPGTVPTFRQSWSQLNCLAAGSIAS